MTEESIEREVERRFDILDRQFIKHHAMNQTEYDQKSCEIQSWADHQYAVLEAIQLLNWKDRGHI